MDFSFENETFVGGADVEYQSFVPFRAYFFEPTDAFGDVQIE